MQENLISLELEKYYTMKGYNLPQFCITNFTDKGFQMFSASVILPNGISMCGDARHSKSEVCIILFDY